MEKINGMFLVALIVGKMTKVICFFFIIAIFLHALHPENAMYIIQLYTFPDYDYI